MSSTGVTGGREAPAPTHRPLCAFAGDTTHASSIARKGKTCERCQ